VADDGDFVSCVSDALCQPNIRIASLDTLGFDMKAGKIGNDIFPFNPIELLPTSSLISK